MKKNLFAFLLIIGFAPLLNAQNISLSKEELTKHLCREWKTAYATMGGMNVGPKANAGFDVVFNSDGSYTTSKSTTKGKWNFDTKKKYVELRMNNKLTSRIISIDEKEFVMVLVSDADGPKGMPDLEIHFIPKL